jgi:hypothetical protein
MTANVQVVIDEHHNVFKVPNAALGFRPSTAETGKAVRLDPIAALRYE